MNVPPAEERSDRRADRRSSQQRTRIVAVGAALLVLLGLVWWFAIRSSGDADDPLAGGPAEAVVVAGTPGAPVSVGAIDLRNTGSSDLVLDRVALLDPTTGLRLVGMYAVPQGASAIGGASSGFSWPRGAVEVEGLTLTPNAAHTVVVALQVDAQGVYRSAGVRIEYHVGERAYVKDYGLGIELCAPTRMYRARCA